MKLTSLYAIIYGSSLELGDSVDVSLEGTVDDICACIVQIWHDWLVLTSIPRYISWLSESVSICGSVVLMVHRGLSGSPFSVSIWNGWVLGKNSGACPVDQVWVVHQCLCVEGIVVHNDWSVIEETSAHTSDNEIDAPSIS